ncbi:MAG: sigma-70 family RNA polymerase sigma factor [Solirubrobacterales bacterium]
MSEFRQLGEMALDRLSDEDLVAYVVAAREAGRPDAGKRASDMLAFRIQPLVEARVAAKVGREAAEDVVMEVLTSFLQSAFDGKVILSVRAFVATIAKRRIADHYRRLERDPQQVPLPGSDGDDEDVWGREPGAEDDTSSLFYMDVVDRLLAERSELHREIIRLYGPEAIDGEDMQGAEVVEELARRGEAVTVANVQQIWHRFKAELRDELRTGEHEVDPDG